MQKNSLRERRRKRRILFGVFILLGFLCLYGGVVWLMHAPFLRITALHISGEDTISSSTIGAFAEAQLAGSYWGLFAKNNVFLYPKNAIAAGLLAQYPALKQADVHADPPAGGFHTLYIIVAERTPLALWCGADPSVSAQCFFLDEDGVAYGAAADFSGDVYKKYYGAISGQGLSWQFLTASQFHSLSALVDALSKKIASTTVDAVSVDNNGDVHVLFANGFTLLFTLGDDAGAVYQHFTLALTADVFKAHKLSDFYYLDLRFGNKLYYKLR